MTNNDTTQLRITALNFALQIPDTRHYTGLQEQLVPKNTGIVLKDAETIYSWLIKDSPYNP